MSEDMVNSPPHYNRKNIEAIQAIEASMEPEEFCGYLKGNILKYLWRYKYKGNPVEGIIENVASLTLIFGSKENRSVRIIYGLYVVI